MSHSRPTDHALRVQKRKEALARQKRNAAERADPLHDFYKEGRYALIKAEKQRRKREEQVSLEMMQRAVQRTFGDK